MSKKESSKNNVEKNDFLKNNKNNNISDSKEINSIFEDNKSIEIASISKKRKKHRYRRSNISSSEALMNSNEMISNENKNNEKKINEINSQKNTNGEIFQKSENSQLKIIKTSQSHKEESFNKNTDNFLHESKYSEYFLQENEDGDLTFRQKLTHFFELNDRLLYIKVIIGILNILSYIYLLCYMYL